MYVDLKQAKPADYSLKTLLIYHKLPENVNGK